MKLELYYVVRPYSGSTDYIGRTGDCELVEGPFKSWSAAFAVKKEQIFSDKYEVVKQLIEVEV